MKTFFAKYQYCDFYGGWSEWAFVSVEAETDWQATDKVYEWVRNEHHGSFKNDNIHVTVFPRIE